MITPKSRLWFELDPNIQMVESGRVFTTDTHPDRLMKVCALVLVISGKRTVRVKDQLISVHKGDFFILPSDIPHFGVEQENCDAFFFHFHSKIHQVKPPEKICSGNILLPLSNQCPTDFDSYQFADYIIRQNMMPYCDGSFISIQFAAMMYQLSLFAQRRELWHNNQATEMAEQIMHYMQDNISESLTHAEYEAVFGKSYRWLNEIFLKRYHSTIKQMQLELRINYAKSLLGSGKALDQVSSMCGFDDYTYFLKCFRNKTGMSPSDYRNRNEL